MAEGEVQGGWRAAQGIAGVVGVAAGIIPLVMAAFGQGLGLWSRILPSDASVPWLSPAIVVVLALSVIAIAERKGR